MARSFLLAATLASVVSSPLVAGPRAEDPVAVARQLGACADRNSELASAYWAKDGSLHYTCADDATAFFPVIGAGPLGLLAAGLLAAAGGGGGGSGGTTGTN